LTPSILLEQIDADIKEAERLITELLTAVSRGTDSIVFSEGERRTDHPSPGEHDQP
jgi:hypothetical protein